MNKLLVIAVLVGLLALSAESFRVPRQAEEEEGTVSRVTNFIKSCYSATVDKASEYMESIRGLKVEEKAKNLYEETKTAATYYVGIFGDQLFHMVKSQ